MKTEGEDERADHRPPTGETLDAPTAVVRFVLTVCSFPMKPVDAPTYQQLAKERLGFGGN